MQIVKKYFPSIHQEQENRLSKLPSLYASWNERINVISRKDIENIAERHILHSLSIARVISFRPGTTIMDAGTGGGFPGIPLAIMFPEVEFLLVDSTGKKIKVVNEIIDSLKLKNAQGLHSRIGDVDRRFEFITARAVTDLASFLKWTEGKLSQRQFNDMPNGIFYLKGVDVEDDMKKFGSRMKVFDISEFFEGEFFRTKRVVYIS